MSDFFAGLAARAREPVAAVRPRLPFRFEDTALGTPALPDETPAAYDEYAPQPAPPPQRAADAAPHAFGTTPIAAGGAVQNASQPQQPSQAAPGTIARVSARSGAVESPAAAPPAAGAVVAFAATPPPAASAPPARTAHDAASEPAQPRSRRAAPAADAIVPAAARERAPLAASPERAVQRGETLAHADAASSRPAAVAANPPLAPPVVPLVVRIAEPPAAIVPRVVRAAPERAVARSAAPAPETTVHVSIGRIEVRAAPGAAERRREAASPAVMSLGDYLSSRAERAQR